MSFRAKMEVIMTGDWNEELHRIRGTILHLQCGDLDHITPDDDGDYSFRIKNNGRLPESIEYVRVVLSEGEGTWSAWGLMSEWAFIAVDGDSLPDWLPTELKELHEIVKKGY